MTKEIKAECTWGDGLDVVLSFEGKPRLLLEPLHTGGFTHGTCNSGQLDLTAKEAKKLATELIMAAERIEDLENMVI